LQLGYSAEDLAAAPEGANLGLGCGNPQAIAALRHGETVLDLGSGAGFDCFLAARQVGPTGRILGVDMTPAMVSKARSNATRVGAENVEFRLGEIEHLPVSDTSVDVILSNCVINLSPDKAAVFREAFRVLRAGGRLAISDIVALTPIPPEIRSRVEAFTGCIAGATAVDDVARMLRDAGFVDIRTTPRADVSACIADWMPGTSAEKYVASATIAARKPGAERSCCGPSCCSPGADA
jgi:SAM-dependent methyltransferase